jgi:hypothetical protein
MYLVSGRDTSAQMQQRNIFAVRLLAFVAPGQTMGVKSDLSMNFGRRESLKVV